MKEGRKESESGVKVGAVTVTVGYNNKQTKKLEIGKTYIMHNHSNNNYALKLRTLCYGNCDFIVVAMSGCVPIRE